MFKIIFYRSKCIGCNACVEAAPDRWRISKTDGKSNLIDAIEKKGVFQAVASDVEFEKNFIAAQNCPVKVIKVL
jgi:ferredoxin